MSDETPATAAPMMPGTRLLRVEACSGVGGVAGIVLVATSALFGGLANSSGWHLGWNDPVNFAVTATAYLGAVAGGLSAVRVQRFVDAGAVALVRTTPTGERQAVAFAVSGILGWAVVSYLLELALAVLRTDPAGVPSAATLALGLLGLANLASSVALGSVVGRWLRWRPVPPLVSVVLFLRSLILVYLPGGAANLALIYPGTVFPPYLRPRLPVLAAQLAASLLLTGGLIALLRSSKRWVIRLGHVGLVTAFCSAVAVIVALGPGATSAATSADAACAQRAGVSLCVWPTDRRYLRSALSSLVPVVQTLLPTYPAPVRYAEPASAAARTWGSTSPPSCRSAPINYGATRWKQSRSSSRPGSVPPRRRPGARRPPGPC